MNSGGHTRECDYSKLMALLLPQFFPFPAWFVVPEYGLIGDYAPDYLVGKIMLNGTSMYHVVVETKNRVAV